MRASAVGEGNLRVRLDVAHGRVAGASVTYNRPGRAAQALAGRSPAEVLALVPQLFSVCSVAQGIACARALEAALGHAAGPRLDAARDAACLAEACASHVWQLGLAWRGAAEVEPALLLVAQARKALGAVCVALSGRSSIASSLRSNPAWGDARVSLRSLAALVSELATRETPLEGLVRASDRATFAALLARLESRRASALGDVERAWARLSDAERAAPGEVQPSVGPGEGTGYAPTARGLLRHCVRVRAERVEELAIESPTDRTFQSDGALRDALVGAEASPSLARDAGWLVLALNPCVPWAIEVRDA